MPDEADPNSSTSESGDGNQIVPDQHVHGDEVHGDKVGGDKISGDKLSGDKFEADQIFIVPTNNQDESRIKTIIIVAIITGIFGLLVAYINYRGLIRQPKVSIEATQTKEAELTAIANSIAASTKTPSPTTTHIPTNSPSPSPTPIPAFLQLTSGNGHNHSPSFSPDGNKIAFVSTRDGNSEIYVMNLDGSDQQRLTHTPGVEEDLPSFSLDGTKIIFGEAGGSHQDLYLMNVDGGNLQNITRTPLINEKHPVFVPGQFVELRILFATNRSGNWEIFSALLSDDRINSLNQITRRPNDDDMLPSYLPSTNQMVFRSFSRAVGGPSNIYITSLGGGALSNLSRDNIDWYPRISSDEQWIVFVSERDEARNEDIYAMRLNGSEIIRLTYRAGRDTTPAISPDGRWLVYASEEQGNQLQLYRVLFVISVE